MVFDQFKILVQCKLWYYVPVPVLYSNWNSLFLNTFLNVFLNKSTHVTLQINFEIYAHVYMNFLTIPK